MNSETHPMNGKTEGANVRRRPAPLALRLMLMLLTLLGASQAWAGSGCDPVLVSVNGGDSSTQIEGQPGNVIAFTLGLDDDGSCSPFFYFMQSEDPAVVTIAEDEWGPASTTDQFIVNATLHAEGNTTIEVYCDAGCETLVIPVVVHATAPPTELQFTSTSGDGQSAPSGSALPDPLVVVLEEVVVGCPSCSPTPVSGATINWEVAPAAASTTPTFSTFTDTGGHAQASITIAPDYVGNFTITARPQADPSVQHVFSATATAVPNDYTLTAVSGDGQTATSGSSLPDPLVVELLNSDHMPVSGKTILWSVSPASAASLSPSSPQTGADGRTSAYVAFASNFTGAATITAQFEDDASVSTSFTATATARTYELSKPQDSGDGATVVPGGSATLRALVTSDGDPAPNRGVTWTVLEGQATPAQRTVNSDSLGISAQEFTFGQTPGVVHIQAVLTQNGTQIQNYTVTVASPTAPDAVTVDYVSGNGQNVTAGQNLPEALVVSVLRSAEGGPAEPDVGATVVWTVSPAAASPTPLSTSTVGSDGTASIQIATSADYTGEFSIRAEHFDAPDAAFVFTATATAPTVSPLELVKPEPGSGDGQKGYTGQALPQPLRVQVLRDGVGVAGISIAWNVGAGGEASLDPATSLTDAQGYATTTVTLGNTPGDISIDATLVEGDIAQTVFFGVTAEAPPVSPIELVKPEENSGDEQSGPAGQTLPQPLRVQVRRDGTGVPDLTITWVVGSGDASLDPATSLTDADGYAATTVTFGSEPGGVLILASYAGENGATQSLSFSLTATEPQPPVYGIGIVSGDGQTAQTGELLPEDFVVEVSAGATQAPASAGRASPKSTASGLPVTWQVASGGGELEAPVTYTDESGRARNRLRLGPQAGAQTVLAVSPSGEETLFTAIATSPTAGATLDIVSGNGQASPPGWPSAPLVVRAVNGAGQPISGLTIVWTAVNATVAPATSVTDADGTASTVAHIATPGPAQITARIQGQEASVTFGLNGGLSEIPILSDQERAYARAMDAMWPELQATPTLTPEQQDLAARCIELIEIADSGQTAVKNALGAMGQDTAPTQANAAISANDAQFDNIASRIVALRGGASGFSLGGLSLAMPNGGLLPLSFLPSAVLAKAAADATAADAPGFARWGFFATGTIGRGKRDPHGENAGYDFDTAGITAGFDYRVRDNLVLGVSLGYNKQDTDLAQGGGKVETDGLSVSLYGSWYSEKSWYLDAVLTHGRNSYDLQRRLQYQIQTATGGVSAVDQIARADGDGTQTSLSVSAGRDFQKGAWSFSPYLRGNLTRIDFDGYEETMLENQPGVGLALGVESRELDSRTLVLGSRFSYTMSRDWGILTPHAHLEWEHEFKDDPEEITAYFRYDPLRTPILINGESLDSNYANVGIGVSALFPRGRSAFILYEKLLGASNLSRDTISIGVRMEF